MLAEAGLLAQRRVTTHWAYGREMQKRFPDTRAMCLMKNGLSQHRKHLAKAGRNAART